jgi:hypothetical protein
MDDQKTDDDDAEHERQRRRARMQMYHTRLPRTMAGAHFAVLRAKSRREQECATTLRK